MDETAHIFVGSDRSQLLAVRVLEHSIARHTTLAIRLRSMHDLELPDPRDPRQGKRTGFSFTRFAIPRLMGYQGRAVYLDADMLVFRDFRELFGLPFDGAKIIIQEGPPPTEKKLAAAGAPAQRAKQCSVMLLDCAALDWDPEAIIAGLDGRYTYEQLLFEMCVLPEAEISYAVPFAWNSLEVYEPGRTGLIHYTDMHTQPWVHAGNANGHLWLDEVRLMLGNGALRRAELEAEIALGHFRPSLLAELDAMNDAPAAPPTEAQVARFREQDRAAGYRPHRAVQEAAGRRREAIAAYEAGLAGAAGTASRALAQSGDGLRRLVGRLRRALG